jgi:hypothetical protein
MQVMFHMAELCSRVVPSSSRCGALVQELHVCGAEEDNAEFWSPYYTQALGVGLRGLTLLTRLHLDYNYTEFDHDEEWDDMDADGIADSVASLPSLQ